MRYILTGLFSFFLFATPAWAASLDLTWSDNATNETQYIVERKVTLGNFQVVATLGSNVTEWSDTTILRDTTYTYRVKAKNAGGDSAYSNEASGILPSIPNAPSNTTVRIVP